ncbi:hypothetical protein PQG02_02110 [Nostoc sp. UHCC 0926]|uniref:hypothetical protein n=1 Tax=unclassified Nostoc TaxID=2593658 RepID=UPI002360194B|nr:hypothetical protein [Nostoc sp. UHCC 0926]WDD33225.1 hypothetical protein PQG02_02110 [Nostoc sp. UHCC 0926]
MALASPNVRRGDAKGASVRAASRREAVASQTLRTVANATLPLRLGFPQVEQVA